MSSNVFKCGKFKIVLIVFLLTSAGMAQTVPLMTENFENGGALPSGWVTEVLNPGNTLSFLTSSTWPSGYGAYSGAYMVCFNSFTAAGGIIRMKNTIPVSTVGYSSISVDFAWLESKNYAGVTDHVEVEWSTDATTWTSAATFQRWNAVQGWKIKSVNCLQIHICLWKRLLFGFGACNWHSSRSRNDQLSRPGCREWNKLRWNRTVPVCTSE